MKKQRGYDGDVQRGVTVGGTSGLVGITTLYTVLAPTSDIRARIAVLLEVGGGMLALVALMMFWIIALIALLIVRGLNHRSLLSAFIPSFAYVTIIMSNAITRLIPEVTSSSSAATVVGLTAFLCTIILVREARISKGVAGSPPLRSHLRL